MASSAAKPVRVFALAKSLNVDTKDLLEYCKELGFDVKNNLSSLEAEQVDQLKDRLNKGGKPAAKKVSAPAVQPSKPVVPQMVDKKIVTLPPPPKKSVEETPELVEPEEQTDAPIVEDTIVPVEAAAEIHEESSPVEEPVKPPVPELPKRIPTLDSPRPAPKVEQPAPVLEVEESVDSDVVEQVEAVQEQVAEPIEVPLQPVQVIEDTAPVSAEIAPTVQPEEIAMPSSSGNVETMPVKAATPQLLPPKRPMNLNTPRPMQNLQPKRPVPPAAKPAPAPQRPATSGSPAPTARAPENPARPTGGVGERPQQRTASNSGAGDRLQQRPAPGTAGSGGTVQHALPIFKAVLPVDKPHFGQEIAIDASLPNVGLGQLLKKQALYAQLPSNLVPNLQ
ncbi:MAG: translation initiation factor IF-2 N-terminal domain-containing protein [Zavarzinella sp.]